MSSKNVETKKPSQDTIDALFQEISDDLMQSINGGAATGDCHYTMVPILAAPTNTGVRF